MKAYINSETELTLESETESETRLLQKFLANGMRTLRSGRERGFVCSGSGTSFNPMITTARIVVKGR